MISVCLISNDGDGRPQWTEVSNGTVLCDFLDMHFGGDIDEFDVTVRKCGESRSQSVDAYDYGELNDGDRVTLSPTKVEGAR